MTDSPFHRILARFEPDSILLDAQPLTGGVSAQVTLLDVRRADGTTHQLIVRQHGERDRQANLDIAADEFKLLQTLHTADIPTARPYYLDTSNTIFPTPYLIIEYLQGRTIFEPTDLDSFLSQFAAYLARLHQLDITTRDLSFLPDQTNRCTAWLHQPPAQLDTSIKEAYIRETLAHVWPPPVHNSNVLLHGDFWPGNAIWREDRLVAMIDWEDAALGDPLWDLAVSRLDILWAFGIEAMHTYTRLYTGFNPIDLTALPHWDLCVALRPANQISQWATDDAAAHRMRQRHHHFVTQAVAALAQTR